MKSVRLPAGSWGISEPDGQLHRLQEGKNRALCGRWAKQIQAQRVPQSLPVCPECRSRSLRLSPGLLAVRTQSLARAAVNALLATGGLNSASQ